MPLSPGEQELQQGLRNGRFKSYFQPKFESGSAAGTGFEVLARGQHWECGSCGYRVASVRHAYF